MAVSGRIGRRLALAIVLTALIPVLAAIWLAETTVRQTSARFFVPEVGGWLDQSLGLYQALARVTKASMRHEATALAESPTLRQAVLKGDRGELERALRTEFGEHKSLVSLSVVDEEERVIAVADRGKPLDPEKEHQLRVARPLSVGRDLQLVAVFAADKARFAELAKMSEFVDTYHKIEERRELDEATYVYAFSALLGITVLAAVGVGALLARGVSSKIGQLAQAAKRVGAGDLSIRVPDSGTDEIADLARSFNTMLDEVEASRARIEYLQRISAWQEMARRLAHEIKNPLTPIQLAAQELHRRYNGQDPAYRKLVDDTLEIVEDEVATLRRLVTEFSDFARMPRAELKAGDLAELLGQLARQTNLGEGERSEGRDSDLGLPAITASELRFQVEPKTAPAMLDRQLMRRALINLVTNADQALYERTGGAGKIVVSLRREGDYWQIDVEDNGPGIDGAVISSVFDPYVTTKPEGTGLGLAIVKKIAVEHGGNVAVGRSALGGAKVRMRIPAEGTAQSDAAVTEQEVLARSQIVAASSHAQSARAQS